MVGKHTVKIVEVANATGRAAQFARALAKATGMRKHQLPEQAGVVTFGASPAVKARSRRTSCRQSRKLVAQAHPRAAQSRRN